VSTLRTQSLQLKRNITRKYLETNNGVHDEIRTLSPGHVCYIIQFRSDYHTVSFSPASLSLCFVWLWNEVISLGGE